MFESPFVCIVAAPSGSGKTVLLRRILENHEQLLDYDVDALDVLWIHGQSQPLHSIKIANCNVTYLSEEDFSDAYVRRKAPHVVVFDDMQESIKHNKEFTNLVIRGSHHLNISVFIVLQNLFTQGTEMRTISLNTHYFILMQNARDHNQLVTLGRQIFPTVKQRRAFLEAYVEATSYKYGYIVINCKNNVPEEKRIAMRIFPSKLLKGRSQPIYLAP